MSSPRFPPKKAAAAHKCPRDFHIEFDKKLTCEMTLSKDFKKGKYELYFPKKGDNRRVGVEWGQEKGQI